MKHLSMGVANKHRRERSTQIQKGRITKKSDHLQGQVRGTTLKRRRHLQKKLILMLLMMGIKQDLWRQIQSSTGEKTNPQLGWQMQRKNSLRNHRQKVNKLANRKKLSKGPGNLSKTDSLRRIMEHLCFHQRKQKREIQRHRIKRIKRHQVIDCLCSRSCMMKPQLRIDAIRCAQGLGAAVRVNHVLLSAWNQKSKRMIRS